MTGKSGKFVCITHLSSGDLDSMSLPVYEETIAPKDSVSLNKSYIKKFAVNGRWFPYEEWDKFMKYPPSRTTGEYIYFAKTGGDTIRISEEEYTRISCLLLESTRED